MNSSFEFIEAEDGPFDAEVLSQLAPFFPSIRAPDSFELQYDHLASVNEARSVRRDGRLFIDELLAVVGLDGLAVFPPQSAAALHQLLFHLLTADSGLLTSNCIIFYLLLDANPTTLRPTAYAKQVSLPVGFVRSVEGFYHLDTGAWRAGVAALVDPHLIPDYVPKTFDVLSTLPPADERSALVKSYWRLSAVPLDGEEQAGIVIDALVEHSKKIGVVEAWALQRKWGNDDERARLAQRVLYRCFGDNATRSPAAHHLNTLLSHPFTPAEDDLATAFCLDPSPPIAESPTFTALAADWRLSKLIAEGRSVEALRFGRQLSSKGLLRADDRARLLRAVRETLTEVQRNAVDLESDASQPAVPSPSSSGALAVNVAQPAWQPTPAPAVQPLPRSLLSRPQPPAPTPAPTPSDLPLSASPFLRTAKPLVSTSSGSALGGVQKNVLRALREGTSPIPPSPERVDAKGKGRAEVFGASPRFPSFLRSPSRGATAPSSDAGSYYPSAPQMGGQASPRAASIVFGLDGREVERKERKPTLSGFGSVRMPSSLGTPARGEDLPIASVEDEDEDVDMDASSPPPPPARKAIAAPKREVVPVVVVPAPRPGTSSHLTASKRRTFSSQQDAPSVSGDKRRAVSTEAEDRPSGNVKVDATPKKPPGAFPGHEHHSEEDEEEPEASVMVKKKAPARRSARASSVQPVQPATPARATRAGSAALMETPQKKEPASAVRRSTRRVVKEVAEEVEEAPPTKGRRVSAAAPRKMRTKKKVAAAVTEESDEE